MKRSLSFIPLCGAQAGIAFLCAKGVYASAGFPPAIASCVSAGRLFASSASVPVWALAGVSAAACCCLVLEFVLCRRYFRLLDKLKKEAASLALAVEDRTRERDGFRAEAEASREQMVTAQTKTIGLQKELEAARRAAERDQSFTAKVQDALFPKHSPKPDGWDIACAFKPRSEVSGDMYDFYLSNGDFHGVSLFDVSGHGTASGLVSLLAKSVASRRFNAGADEKLNRVVEQINHDLVETLGNEGTYLTGTLLRFHHGEVDYVNAGHTDLLFKKGSSGAVKQVDPRDREFKGNILGVAGAESCFNMVTFRMAKGDCVLLYSDCLIESVNGAGERYGVERVMQSLEAVPADESAQTMMIYVIGFFVDFVGSEHFQDDLTVILIRKTS